MREFTKVSNSIWNSGRFNSLGDDQCKLFYLYLLTCPHSNSSGVYTLKKGYAAADLGWSTEAISKAISKAIEVGLIAYDERAETVWIAKWYAFNPPTNAKHALGILAHLKQAASVSLKLQALQGLVACIKERGFTKDAGLVNAVNTLVEAYQEAIATETETKTETESRPDKDKDFYRDAPCGASPGFAAATPDGAARPAQETKLPPSTSEAA